MTPQPPKFIDSPYLIVDYNGWRLKEDAPDKLKKEFEEYIKQIEEEETK